MRLAKKTQKLNVMVVGASGTGKTALVSTLIEKDAQGDGEYTVHRTVVQDKEIDVIDTRGYGAKSNVQEKLLSVCNYIKMQYRDYLAEEMKIERSAEYTDNRVHLVVHFLSVSHNGMKEHDVALLKLLHDKVNVMVVVPKCDQHTAEEIEQIRHSIRQRIAEEGIDLFDVHEIAEEKVPMCIFGASSEKIDGKAYVGRNLPSGKILVCDDAHSDILLLMKVLDEGRSDLQYTTDAYFYEKYRAALLSQ